MRYGIFSDVHANLEALDSVLDAYNNESIDQYFCVGDIVGYSVNPVDCIDLVKSVISVSVAGNHDWASVDLVCLDYFNEFAREAVLWTNSRLDEGSRDFLKSLQLVYKNKDLTLVHGTLANPGEFNYMNNIGNATESFVLLDTKICFVGHSHVPGIFVQEKNKIRYLEEGFIEIKPDYKYIVNAGSVGQPRDGNPQAAYCVYDTEKKGVWIKRVSYDVGTARDKIVEAGLPELLGDRLLAGR